MIQAINCPEYKALQKSVTPHLLIDVREQDEWDAGHIEGAVHIPLGVLPLKIDELVPEKDTLLIMQCRSGGRSAQATDFLMRKGYTNVKNLDGGYLSYKAL